MSVMNCIEAEEGVAEYWLEKKEKLDKNIKDNEEIEVAE